MNINYFISLIETVKQDSISKASKKLHMTQSALSQQLQALEKTLDSKLLIRSNKGVDLTDEGEIVLSYAETLVNLYENMVKELNQCKNSLIQEIKISTCNSVGEYLLPCTLHLYKKSHDDVRFVLKNEHTKRVIEHVLDCSADIGFIDCEINIDGVECFNICSNNLLFVHSSKIDMKKECISLNEIASLPLIIGSKGSGIRDSIEDMFSNAAGTIKSVNIEMELDTIESIKASVIANHGVSILPNTSVKQEIHAGILKTLPIIDAKPKCNICLISSKSKASQPHIKTFIQYIMKYGRETFC
ncbi:LysR family transcriptional regulator [Clostridium sp. UBA6640]|uniref:LysR family transcriptional regulator n=1 Tax=Clostridium sp. UBA6640 TaxID=1946370 RepID=UPI0025BFB9C9|nr:LysR family transcriptional regulator [Clostridium sp. UBA6640]